MVVPGDGACRRDGAPGGRRACGFTLIELLVVLAIVASLLMLVAPRFTQSVDRAAENALKMNLRILRESIDRHAGDLDRYPESLEALVTRGYLRSVPMDPVTGRADTWVPIGHPGGAPGVYDLRSGAPGVAIDGSAYASW